MTQTIVKVAGSTHASKIAFPVSGFSSLPKAPTAPYAKKHLLAFFVASLISLSDERSNDHQWPKHFANVDGDKLVTSYRT